MLTPSIQAQFHEYGIRERAVAVRRYVSETQRTIEGDRVAHSRCNRVQPDPSVTEVACLLDDLLRELATQFEPPMAGPDVQPLHLAHVVDQGPQRDTAGGLLINLRQEDAARRL